MLKTVPAPKTLQVSIKYEQKKHKLMSFLEHTLNIVGKNKLVEHNILIEKTRLTLEMTEFTCNLIENCLPSTNSDEVDKKRLCIDILTEIYALTFEEQDIINKQIQYIYNSNLILRLPLINKITNLSISIIKNWFNLIIGKGK